MGAAGVDQASITMTIGMDPPGAVCAGEVRQHDQTVGVGPDRSRLFDEAFERTPPTRSWTQDVRLSEMASLGFFTPVAMSIAT
jgi:hypothetical protein